MTREEEKMGKWVEWGGTRRVGMIESEEKAGSGVEPGRQGGRTGPPSSPPAVHGVLGVRGASSILSSPWAARPGVSFVKGKEARPLLLDVNAMANFPPHMMD